MHAFQHLEHRRPSRVDAVALVALPLLALAMWALFRGLQVEAAAWRWVTHTHEVMESLDRALGELRAAESAHRDHLLTGDARVLDHARTARAALAAQLDAIGALTRDNPRQQQALATLRNTVAEREARLDRLADERARQAGAPIDAAWLAAALASDAGAGAALDAMRGEEERLLAERTTDVARARRQAQAAGVVLGALALVLVIGLRTVASRDTARIRLGRERLDATLRSMGDAVIATDANGRIEVMNGVAERLTGWREDEARGRALHDVFRLVDGETRAPLEGPLPTVLREGRTAALPPHALLVARDGTERVIEDSGAPIRGARGAIDGAVLVFVDASERHAAERERARLLDESQRALAALQAERERLALALDAAAAGAFEWDIATGRVTLSPELQRLVGFAPGTFNGELAAWERRMHPDDRARLRALYERLWRERAPEATLEFRVAGEGGAERSLYGRARLFYDAEGRPLRMVGIDVDITELRRAEAREREAGERYRQVLEALPQLVWTCMPTGEADFLSRQWRTYTGTTLEDNLGYGWLAHVHPQDRDALVARWQAAVRGARTFDAEARLRAADGSYRWFKQRAVALKRADGSVERWFGTSTDITDLVAARDAVAEANAALEERVAERTRRLGEANAELQSFAHTVAHDLRAPLRNIEGFAAALLEDEADRLSPEGATYAQRIAAGAVRMDGLITDLLAYSRLARAEIRLEPVDLGGAVAGALADLEQELRASHAIVERPGRWPQVRAHAPTLRQVLANLLGNAIKFVPPGTVPRVTITTELAGDRVRLAITDNGIGIAPEHQERVFGVFERLHGAEQYPGTGIGLAIVRRGLERMGGRVRLASAPGRGSRFEIDLPLALAEQPLEPA